MAELQAIVLAGGGGSRMFPLTPTMTKAMLPVGGMPMFFYSLLMLERVKFAEAIIITQRSGARAIRHYLENVADLTMKYEIVEIDDQDSDIGTADALRLVHEKIYTDFIVLSSDLITNIPLHSLVDVHRLNDASVTVLLNESPPDPEADQSAKARAQDQNMQDYVGFDPVSKRLLYLSNQADHIEEESLDILTKTLRSHPRIQMRTDLVDAHAYIFAKWVIDFVVEKKNISTIKGELVPYLVRRQFARSRPGKCDPLSFATKDLEDDMYDQLAVTKPHTDAIRCFARILGPEEKSIMAVRANTIPSYMEANRLVPRHIDSLWPATIGGSPAVLIHSKAEISKKTQVGGDSIVGGGVVIGDRCSVKRSVIGKHCQIGDKVKISNSVIMDHVNIGNECVIQNSIVCQNAHIQPKCSLTGCQVSASFTVKEGASSRNESLGAEVEDAF